MTKEEIIDLIDSRIKTEYRKHKDLEWSKIAAHKIYGSLVKLFAIPDVSNNEALGSGVGVAVCYHTNAYEIEGGWKYCPDCGVKYIVVAN